MPATLTKASVADIPELIKIEQSVAGTNIYSPMLGKNEWEKALQEGPVFLIKEDGVVAGNISYEHKGGGHYHISGLAIMPQFQNRGIGKGALASILKECKDAKRIDLAVHPDNESAIKLYESLGFVVETRKENYYGDGEPRLIFVLLKSR
ncbi:MAG: GNAT family N-acetyltransferase [Parcubacteria group bacterium]|nr:GNAT family N-acetyltransferase [Parcubacteria group bacterium]